MNVRREVVAALCAVGLMACAAVGDDNAQGAVTPSVDVTQTVSGVGVLPAPVTTAPASSPSTTAVSTSSNPGTSTTSPVAPSVPVDPGALVGEAAAGNRVLMIGDSILASASKRYGDEICQVLVPMGWRVRVEAEVSRFIDFGKVVADRVMGEGWDAGLVFLGTNYNRDPLDYFEKLNKLINRFGDAPVVLVTVTERDADFVRVNDIITDLADTYPNVSVVEWGAATGADPSLLNEDGIHASPLGRITLAMMFGQRFGTAPADAGAGRCLDQVFRDDSGEIPGLATTTTAPQATPTTVPRSTTTIGGGTTVPSTTAPSTTSPSSTSPPSTTSPPPTSPPTTTPPPTSPPTTSPPPTSPPTTPPPLGP